MSETKFQPQPTFKFGDWVQEEGNTPFEIKYVYKSEDGFFYSDTAYKPFHKEPSLKLIERTKKKVTKTMYQAIYEGVGGLALTSSLYSSEEAREVSGFIALGPAITFEVEE